jgi:uncharacterized protein
VKKLISALVLSLAAFTTVVVAQPTVKEIYQTAQTDKQQALNMINDVIRSRPNSARAYYIQSELLLQMGKKSEAKASFLKSQQLDPALSFAKPESVARLENALGIKKPLAWQTDTNRYILYGCGILLVILIAVMLLRRKQPKYPNYMESYNLQNRPITPYQSGQTATSPMTPTGASGAPTTAAAPAAGGSNLMGSLAQGAVMGVGVAAGATLANHLLNGNKASAAPAESATAAPAVPSYTPDSNFGMTDTGSDWGSGSSGDSGGDWGGDSSSGDSGDW